MNRTMITAAIALAAATSVGLSTPVNAGGWAVTTLDAFPPAGEVLEPGEPVDVSFTIRQHGVTPVDVADVAMVVEGPAGDSARFPASTTGSVGHYVATVVFPDAGRHEWTVEQGLFGPQELGVIDIGGSTKAAAARPVTGSETEPRWPLALRLALPLAAAGLGLTAATQLLGSRRRSMTA